MAETKGGATRGKRKAFLQKFFAGSFTIHIKIAGGNAMILAAIVTAMASRMLFKKLSLTAMFDHTTGKRCMDMFVDFQNKNNTGYPVKIRKKSNIVKKIDLINSS